VYSYSLVVLLNHLQPGWSADMAMEVSRVVDARRERHELEHQLDAMYSAREAKKEVVNAMIEERLTLREAAARFQDLNTRQMSGAWWMAFRRRFAGSSDEERHCREVIHFTRCLMADLPAEESATVSQRLEIEMQEQLGYDPYGVYE
jgi:hypothetical protein